MLANIRRDKICSILKKQQAVTTAELAKRFGVSIETIRKDLLELERQNELVRVHGGACRKPEARIYRDFSARLEENLSQKAEISKTAADLIENGDIIAMDTGSTAIEFIDVLMDRFDTLTIVTHSLDVFKKACNYKNFEIILCGGFYMREENSFYGSFTLNMFDSIRVKKVFIFPNSVSLNHGISDSVPNLAEIQKKLMSIGDKVVVVADSSKYETNSFIKIDDMNPKYTYISDSRLPDELEKIYENNGITILTGKEKGNAKDNK